MDIHLRFAATALLLACMCLAGCASQTKFPPGDREARQTAEAVLEAMGGRDALDEMRFLRFDFVVMENGEEMVRRTHFWDRETGNYRLEATVEEKPVTILFNIESRQGYALQGYESDISWNEGGQEWHVLGFSPEQRMANSAQMVEQAYAWHINDTYWLLSATKINDPGTHLKQVEPREIMGRTLEVLHLTFEPDTGLTPLDQYWFYLDPNSKLPVAWSFVLKGQRIAPTTFLWGDWTQTGRLSLPTRFDMLDGNRAIVMERVSSLSEIEDRVFDPVVRRGQ